MAYLRFSEQICSFQYGGTGYHTDINERLF